MKPTVKNLSVASLLLALANGCATHPTNPAPAAPPSASGGITDAEIRDVLNRVARHQIQSLQDGEYPEVRSIEEAQAARVPEGIMWNYPWGVALFGMECSTDVTRDWTVDNFVVQHNLICARYYAWLARLEKQFGNDAEKFALGTKLKEFITLGKLDNCGAMGNAMLESMLRHPGRTTRDERAVVARAADWVINRQDRLPDGTLWRSKVMGGTVWPDDLYMGGVFLVRYSLYTGDHKYLEDAANQIIHQAALEQDAD
ncbi:MAG TPA: glycoside hydrolase family 88 protein, partial [Verrucomicrobiae bacterium]|nr:glycoside hydrolase family 88 protein [Verrucomicrobiae bacterium]